MNKQDNATAENEKQDEREQESELEFELAIDVLDLKYGATERRR